MKKKPDNVFYKHKLIEHVDEGMKIKMEILQPYKDTLTCQANEAVRIKNRSTDKIKESLNSKSQFNHPPITRLTVQKVGNTAPMGVAQTRKVSTNPVV